MADDSTGRRRIAEQGRHAVQPGSARPNVDAAGPATGRAANGRDGATQPMFNTYALGWDVRDYRGAKIVWHGGAVFGFLAAVVLIPEKQVGFSILINSEDGEIINGLMFELLDHYLGHPANDWPAKFRAL